MEVGNWDIVSGDTVRDDVPVRRRPKAPQTNPGETGLNEPERSPQGRQMARDGAIHENQLRQENPVHRR